MAEKEGRVMSDEKYACDYLRDLTIAVLGRQIGWDYVQCQIKAIQWLRQHAPGAPAHELEDCELCQKISQNL